MGNSQEGNSHLLDDPRVTVLLESRYEDGRRMVLRRMLGDILKELGYCDPGSPAAAAWFVEREDALAAIRRLCEEYGDTSFPPDLHLADIIDKHLAPYLDLLQRKVDAAKKEITRADVAHPDRDGLRVIIYGCAGTGKTAVAMLIRKCLEDQWMTVDLQDHYIDPANMRILERVIQEKALHYRKVEIRTQQIARTPKKENT